MGAALKAMEGHSLRCKMNRTECYSEWDTCGFITRQQLRTALCVVVNCALNCTQPGKLRCVMVRTCHKCFPLCKCSLYQVTNFCAANWSRTDFYLTNTAIHLRHFQTTTWAAYYSHMSLFRVTSGDISTATHQVNSVSRVKLNALKGCGVLMTRKTLTTFD